jgi:hypothetical protein
MGDIDQYYQILEIQPGASLEEVKQAYRDLVFVWHPDRFPHNDRLQQKAQQRLTEINQAYQQLLLFLSQPELKAIEPQFQPPTPPAPVRENLNRKSFKKPAGRSASQKSQNYRKATSKSQKGFKTPNRETFLGKRSNFKTPNRTNPTPKRKKQFSTQYSKPRNFPRETRQSQKYSSFPWWPLAIALASYALTGWILTKSAAPLWMWISICGADGLWAAILIAEGSATPRVWLTALALAGAVGGAIAGFQAGGAVTGGVWAMIGAGLGAIASSEAESRAVASVFAITGVATVTGLIAGTGSGDWVRTLVGAICWGMLGLICGLIAELAVDSDSHKGLVGLIGLGIGAWLGSGSGASSEALVQALAIAGSKTVYGAWAAIGIIAGVVAKMVAAERAIGPGKQFYTSILLLATSGFGLWLGYWLGDRI